MKESLVAHTAGASDDPSITIVGAGVYMYFYKTICNDLICKVGGTEEGEDRIYAHLTSCAGMDLAAWVPCSKKEVWKLEKTVLAIFRENFTPINNNKEQFIICNTSNILTTEELLALIRPYLPSDLIDSMKKAKRGDNKDITYLVNNLYNKETDIRDDRPTCNFLSGEDAQITTKAGVDEKYRTVLCWMDKAMKKLDAPITVYMSSKAWLIYRRLMYTKEMELLINEQKSTLYDK